MFSRGDTRKSAGPRVLSCLPALWYRQAILFGEVSSYDGSDVDMVRATCVNRFLCSSSLSDGQCLDAEASPQWRDLGQTPGNSGERVQPQCQSFISVA